MFRTVCGIKVRVDRPKGFVQKFKDGSTRKYLTDYGAIPKTKGGDGENVDVYIGPNPDGRAFSIKQLDQKTGKYDEDKLMLGFDSKEEARRMYERHFPKEMLPRVWGGIREIDPSEKIAGIGGLAAFGSKLKQTAGNVYRGAVVGAGNAMAANPYGAAVGGVSGIPGLSAVSGAIQGAAKGGATALHPTAGKVISKGLATHGAIDTAQSAAPYVKSLGHAVFGSGTKKMAYSAMSEELEKMLKPR